VTPALLRSSLRHLARHPWQSWLSVLGIALGVAVVVAVDLANQSARTAFQLSVERIAGRATHQIESASGSIPDRLYPQLRTELGLRQAAPLVEGTVQIFDRTFTLLGVDPFASASLRQGGTELNPRTIVDLLTRPGALLLAAADARELDIDLGAKLELEAQGRTRQASLAGTLDGEDAALEGIAIADIASAQELLGRLGSIDRIDLILSDKRAATLADELPPGLRLVAARSRSNALGQMTRAFHSNLTAMSLLAVLVGGFIVYNTMTFAVLRRRPLLGTFRTLGVTRSQLFALVLGEALLFALVGALLGIAAGILVGWGLVQLVTRTINDIYFALSVTQLFISPWSLIKGAGLGVLATLIAALGPAVEAATSQPRDVLRHNLVERQGRRLLPWLALSGAALMAAGFALVQIPTHALAIGFVALFAVVVGFGLCIPLMLRGIGALATPLLDRYAGVPGRLAARGIDSSISRTGIAVAALTVAVSATVGVGIMIDSFRGSVVLWLENTLSSDIYVSAPSSSSSMGDGDLPVGIDTAIRAIPGVADISKGRSRRVETQAGPVALLALESSSRSHRGFRFKGETAADLWTRFEAGDLALISEPYAFHHKADIGDPVRVFTAQGWREMEVGGIFMDYGSDSGTLVLPRWLYARLWDDQEFSTVGVVLAPDADPVATLKRLRTLAGGYDRAIRVRANRTIREQSLEIFDRTFVITRVLRILAVGVAFIGVLSALMALQLEHAREHAILRATGVTRRQLLSLILFQTSLMGLAAGLLAMPLGWIMGSLLIKVINVRSFGWTMDMVVPWSALVSGVGLAWIAALLAGLYPARKTMRTDPAMALRDE
jgi:putative ABC transport system permease protein